MEHSRKKRVFVPSGDATYRESLVCSEGSNPAGRELKGHWESLSFKDIGQFNSKVKSLDWVKERRTMTGNTLKWYCSVFLITLLLGSLQKCSGEACTLLSTEISSSPWRSQEMNAPMHSVGQLHQQNPGILWNEPLFAPCSLCLENVAITWWARNAPRDALCTWVVSFGEYPDQDSNEYKVCWHGRRNDTEFCTKTCDLFHL